MISVGSPTTPTTIAEVDATQKALRVSARPIEALGHYRMGAVSGLLTSATVAAAGPLFSMRWTDAAKLFVLQYLRAKLVVTTAFTAVQELGLDAIVARSFSVSDSAGTNLTPSSLAQANTFKKRASYPASVIGDMRISTTTVVTAGTRTLDSQAFAQTSGITHDPNVAAATAQIIAQAPQLLLDFTNPLDHPLILGQNEGLLIRNTIVFPAAGVARLEVEMEWAEVSAY